MTKISQIRPVLLSAPYGDPETNLESITCLPTGFRTTGLVEITLDNGIKGLGEGYIAVFAPAVFVALVKLIGSYLLGKDVMKVNELYRNMILIIGYWSRQGAAMHAVSAVEIALNDCKAKVLEIPVYDLYGGKTVDSIPLYGSGGDSIHPKAMSEEFDFLEKKTIKLFKIRASKHQVLKAVWCLEAAKKYGIEVAIDMTQNLTTPGNSIADVLEFIQKIKDKSDGKIHFLEESLGFPYLSQYPFLRQQLSIKIAGGEIVTNSEELCQRAANQYYDIFQPDATVIGGIKAVLEVFSQVNRTGGEVVVHCWGGAVGMMANYHAAFASGGSLLEYPMPQYPLREELLIEPLRIEDGQLWISDIPGLGVKLTPEIEEKYPFRPDSAYICAMDNNRFPDAVWQ